MENMNFQRMLEAVDLFNSLNLAEDLKPYIQWEKHRSAGTENFYGLLHAIKNRLQITFSYQKFWEDESRKREAAPYSLKEFKNRWYVLAKDLNDDKTKCFALDRLTNIDITKKTFDYLKDSEVNENYRFCFGIISPNGMKPQEIILSFSPSQGKYIKSLPLHETQEILIDNDKELQVRLRLCVTLDFVMELLSYADNVRAIKPQSLIREIKQAHKRALKQYI